MRWFSKLGGRRESLRILFAMVRVHLRPVLLVILKAQDEQRDVVGLWGSLGEVGYCLLDGLMEGFAGVVGAGFQSAIEAADGEELTFGVLRFGDSIGIGHQFVSAFHLQRLNFVFGAFDQTYRKCGGAERSQR